MIHVTTGLQHGDMRVVAAEFGDVSRVGQTLRRVDREEIWDSHHQSAEQALLHGFRASSICLSVRVKRKPIAMFGVVPDPKVPGRAAVWLLGSDSVRKNWRSFVRLTRPAVALLLKYYPVLFNYVRSTNEETIAWLEWCGAEFGAPAPFGAEGQPFRPFTIQRESCHV